MKKRIKRVLIGLSIIAVFLFYLWTKLFFISGIILLIIDSLLTKYFPRFLKGYFNKKLYSFLKYSYIFSLPIVFVIFFRTFLFDVYFVPSSSMEGTLFPNDYVVINKVKYGVRIPNHFRNVAVIGGFFNPPENATKLYNSLPGFKKIKKEDIVVFKAVDGSDKFLIKRIIGMPSDTLEIVNSKVLINTIELNEKEEYTHKYVLKYKNRVSIFNNYSNLEYKKLSKREKEIYKRDIKKKPNFNYLLFPAAMQNLWTRDNYGKIIIPKKGLSLVLNNENINIYKSILKKFEGVSFELNENETKHYVFKNNYYFMLGDNRHNSLDSRSFGFVPESYIQGKMIKIFSGKRE